MAHHQYHQRGLHGRTMSSEERSSTPVNKTSVPVQKSASSSSSSQRDSRQEADSWEIIEGLKIGQSNVQRPDKHEGFMLKKRKWPLKGWHKRFFVLDNGILKYSKTPIDVSKPDRPPPLQSISSSGTSVAIMTVSWASPSEDAAQRNRSRRDASDKSARLTPSVITSPQQAKASSLPWQPVAPSSSSNSSLQASYSNGQSRVVAWLQESEEMDKCAEELARCQSNLTELSRLLQSLEILQRTQSAPNFTDMQANCVELSKKEKRLNRRWRTKSVGKDAKFQLQVPLSASMSPVRLHSSNPNLCAELADYQPPVSRLSDSVEYASDYIKLQEEFCTIAQKVHSLLKSAFNTVAIEKEKIKQILSEQEQPDQSSQIISLRKSLSLAVAQNAELRSRLNRIHSESILTDQVVSVNIIATPAEAVEQMGIPLTQQASNESRLSMSESVSEFFDAQEVLLSASSSENEGSDDESYVSDVSDNISEDNASVTDNVSRQMANGDFAGSAFRNGRRICLPAPCPDTANINLWNILRNNIGKDLSKVSMPVELNEPLNTLQRMCEELEYSELLDKAAETEDPFERMVLVAAFAISGYSSTYYRAGSKPFNPLLGETYECIREDKGFCFFSEQVSHHPPISACHCESKNFTFWQDVRWKNKFWGKSMEILPMGSTADVISVELVLYGRRWKRNPPPLFIVCYSTGYLKGSCNAKSPCLALVYLESQCRKSESSLQILKSCITLFVFYYLFFLSRKVVDANRRERWVSNNTYWELRKNPGFINMEPTVSLW
uniref:Oxysterol-binding protein n=1 Tax=Fundulus heteroclitus TaxID=8078 RepID=A0A3Q2SZC3_FUNHE